MLRNRFYECLTTVVVLLWLISPSAAQLTEQQAKRIEVAVPTKATATPAKPRRLLIWNTPFMDKCPHKGYCVPQAEYAMRLLGEKTGAFESVASDDVAMYLPENLKRFDAILFNNSNGPWIRPTPEDMDKFKNYGSDIDAVEKLLRRSLLDYVTNGGGIVAYHHAVGGNTHWPAFQELLGAAYWGHPWNEEVGIKLDDPDHPLLAAFNGRDFRLAEEIFQFREPYSREKLRVLLSLDTQKTNMTVPWIHRKDGDFALAWVKRYGKGRVFYSAIGHRTEIWWHPQILRFYLDGIQFAMGDLPADTTPSARVQEARAGFRSLFNGRDLTGWKGNPKLWFVADGGHIVLKINGVVMTEVQDDDPNRIESGKLALQVHQGPDMKVQFKDIRMRQF